MKCVVSLFFVLLLIFSLFACRGDNGAGTDPVIGSDQTASQDVPQTTQMDPAAMTVGDDFVIFRQPEEITVFPFTQEELQSAFSAAEETVNNMKAEKGVVSFQVEALSFDPMLTDIHVRQKIAQDPVPGWEERDYYEHYISFALVYSAAYDHNVTFHSDVEHGAIGIHLHRAGTADPWKEETAGVPTAEYSDTVLDAEELREFEGEGVRALAGYRPNTTECWLYYVNEETGAVTYEIKAAPESSEPPQQTSEPLPSEQTEAETSPAVILPESVPQHGEPISPQPGDTTSTWDATRIADHPSDENCTDVELLEKWMAVEGLTYMDLDERDCDQLILVVARETDGVQTYTTCYERQSDGTWGAVDGLIRMNGHTGYNGISHNRKRDTNTSPAGLWGLGTAFGNSEKPSGLKMPWRSVTPNSDWVCDANSIYFNTWQERDDPTLEEGWDYGDVEHLEDYVTQYAYACVIQYNTQPYTIADRGCAIFLHCSKGATGGCIGLEEEDMVNTLCWLDPNLQPHILISGHQ